MGAVNTGGGAANPAEWAVKAAAPREEQETTEAGMVGSFISLCCCDLALANNEDKLMLFGPSDFVSAEWGGGGGGGSPRMDDG